MNAGSGLLKSIDATAMVHSSTKAGHRERTGLPGSWHSVNPLIAAYYIVATIAPALILHTCFLEAEPITIPIASLKDGIPVVKITAHIN